METSLQATGIERRVSTAYHPQTDGATERINAEVKKKISRIISDQLDDWAMLLPMAQLALNGMPSSAMGTSPFFLEHGYHLQPIQLRLPIQNKSTESSPTQVAERIAKKLKDTMDWVQVKLNTVQQDMETQANKHRQAAPTYKPDDDVWLKLRKQDNGNNFGRKLRDRNGRYKVLEQVTSHDYKLDIPGKAHNTFHVDLLHPAGMDPLPSQALHDIRPPPVEVDGDLEYEVEKILRRTTKNGQKGYMVKWTGYRRPTFELEEAIEDTVAFQLFLDLEGGDDVRVCTSNSLEAGSSKAQVLAPPITSQRLGLAANTPAQAPCTSTLHKHLA
jgi:hypothetical protein